MPFKFRISWRGRPYVGYFPPFRLRDIIFNYGKCPECRHYLVKRNGKYGKFIGCSNYPNCTYTEDFVDKKKFKKFVGKNKTDFKIMKLKK